MPMVSFPPGIAVSIVEDFFRGFRGTVLRIEDTPNLVISVTAAIGCS